MCTAEVRDTVRDDPAHKNLEEHIGMGKRTRAALLRIELSRSADSTLVLQEVQEIIGGSGVARVVTEMTELLVTHIDPLAEEQELKAALKEELQVNAGVTAVSMWQLFDGMKRARLRLPTKAAKQLAGRKLRLCGCISSIMEAMPVSVDRQRCYRCLERGHLARDCQSPVDRQQACIRCGADGHYAKSCTSEIKCAACNGPHRIGHISCARPAARCLH